MQRFEEYLRLTDKEHKIERGHKHKVEREKRNTNETRSTNI